MALKWNYNYERTRSFLTCLSTDEKTPSQPIGSILLETDTGKWYNFTGDGWSEKLVDRDYFEMLALGLFPDRKSIYKFGRNGNVSTSEVFIATGGYYGLPTVARTVQVTSTSGNDSPSGTGARTVLVQGLDANFDEIEEVLDLGATSTLEYIRVYRVIVLTDGNGLAINGANAGTISVTQTTSGTIMIQIAPTDGQTKTACYTIPRGYVALAWSVDVTTGSGKSIQATIKSRDLTVANSAFEVKGVRDVFENTARQDFKIPPVYGEKSDIVLTALATASDTPVSGTFQLELIKI